MSERKYVDADLLYYNAVNNMRLEKSSEWQNGYATCLKQIQDAPAADVQEVKHSHWTQVSVTDYQAVDGNDVSIASMFCPNCKRWSTKVYVYGNPTEHVNYCSFCGAKMDGKDDEK